MFAKYTDDLIRSATAFMEAPEYWRTAVGNSPKYFLHFWDGHRHNFGLSKFCAFKGINLLDYVTGIRFKTGGGDAQKRIGRITEQKWITFKSVNEKVQHAFQEWFFNFFPDTYDLKRISIISLNKPAHPKIISQQKISRISPDDLVKRLQRQSIIGKVGEEIAYYHEIERLANMKIRNPQRYIDHASKRNVAAGLDILTEIPRKEIRFIEVKSSTNMTDSFFITRNEVETLQRLGKDAYLYIVLINDIKRRKGRVISEIRNPVKHIKAMGSLEPIVYKLNIPFPLRN
ncbi:MAG: DUF3883 domain-containing protein [Candidatus Helarchaeota archaeon]|nr:DUF3883 domain-containing protein [Candidatus Helarchaeota archaeon]